MVFSYQAWLDEVRAALDSINMPVDDWQRRWAFDFEREYRVGTSANDTAAKANRFWWREQNKVLKQDCQLTPNCWLPRAHQGKCQPL